MRKVERVTLLLSGLKINWVIFEFVFSQILEQRSREVNSVEQVNGIVGDNKIVVGYFGEENSQYELFQRVQQLFEDQIFIHSFDPLIKEHFKQNIVLFKQFDERRNDYEKEQFNALELYEFILEKSKPSLPNINSQIFQKVFLEYEDGMFMLLDFQKHGKEYNEFEAVAKELRDRLIMSIGEEDVEMGNDIFELFDIEPNMLPLIVLVNATENQLKKYKMESNITEKNIKIFYQEYQEGKLKPITKSEEIPEKNDGAIKKVVGKNFKEIVLDSGKDVIIKFYAPWCSFSQEIQPIYENVAAKVKDYNNLIIADCDATKNENEEIHISGYPTIMFYPANNKQSPIKFEDGRNEEDIINFIKKYSTFKLDEESQK